MNNEYLLINRRVRELRQKLELSQEKFAEKAGLSLNTIAKIDSDDSITPHTSTLLKLAVAFNVDIRYFFQDYIKTNTKECGFLVSEKVSEEFQSLTVKQQHEMMQVMLHSMNMLDEKE